MQLTDSREKLLGPRPTYRCGGNIVAAAGTLPFLVINGAAGRVVRVTKIRLTGFTLTAVGYLRVLAQKHSSAWTGGTPVAITETKTDSGSPDTLVVVTPYTAGPTGGGAVVGPLSEQRALGQATTATSASILAEITIEGNPMTADPVATLRSAAENVSLSFGAAPATAVTLSFEIEYTEDGN